MAVVYLKHGNTIRFTPTPVGNIACLLKPVTELAVHPPRLWGIFNKSCWRRGNLTVHPHACGEYAVPLLRIRIHPGSPPRLWGIYRTTLSQFWPRAVHPHACGNMEFINVQKCKISVHPHACGEYLTHPFITDIRGGSPPRLWGICGSLPEAWRQHRFTPTPVGNISSSSMTGMGTAVHPHACGEYTLKF